MDLIIAGILLIVIGGAVAYIIREKRRGVHCVGCPDAGSCPHKGKCAGGSAAGGK